MNNAKLINIPSPAGNDQMTTQRPKLGLRLIKEFQLNLQFNIFSLKGSYHYPFLPLKVAKREVLGVSAQRQKLINNH